MKDSLMNHGFSICATIMKKGILLSKKRDKTKLHKIIQKAIIVGCTIHSDGWSRYNFRTFGT